MGSDRFSRVAAAQLVALFLAGASATLAFGAGYYATFVIACLAGLWTAGLLLTGFSLRMEGDSPAEQAWLSAMLARERQARSLAAFLDHAPVPLLALGGDGSLTALNLSARSFFATDDVVRDAPVALTTAALEAAPGERRTLTLAAEGGARSFALTTSELTVDGALVRVVALVDIQAEIQAAEAAALRELIQVLSHEIMNSLTPVTSLAHTAAELLRAPDAAVSEEVLGAVEAIERRSEGLLRFIGAYRELARLPAPQLAEVSVAALLEEVSLLFRSRWEARGVSLTCATPPDVTVAIDRDLMAQALLNVLANAAEAALEGAGPPAVRLSAERTGRERLSISVADNGPGIALEDPSVIFRPFYTTKPAGTGVGLSLARQVVLAHGGAIGVASPPEGGAVVAITL